MIRKVAKEILFKKLIFNGLLLVVCIFLVGCSKRNEQIPIITQENTENEPNPREKIMVWSVYWDKNIMDEVIDLGNSIEGISYFAAYFNEDMELFIPDSMINIYEKIQSSLSEHSYISYLSFVNDLLKTDQEPSLKDTQLLYYLLEEKEARLIHIHKIIALAKEYGFDGIEIDYEAIKKDMNLWDYFVDFVRELYEEASNEGLLLRILLEPSAPVDTLELPKGPEYVVMCYNLYGHGTNPGPKADKEFLLSTVEKMKSLPGKVSFAIATGGFDFSSLGVRQVTKVEAEKLGKQYGGTITRDKKSKSLVLIYQDEEDVQHEVWYADNETLEYWIDTIKSCGDYGISLWRLGGNLSNN